MNKVQTITVLGTKYKIIFRKRNDDKYLADADGYCDKTSKEIVVCGLDDDCQLKNPNVYIKKVMRHEIIHAFLFESGLHECGEYGAHDNCHPEQIVDWIAVQYPKFKEVFDKLEI